MDATGVYLLDILKAALKGETYTLATAPTREQWEKILHLAWQHHLVPLVFEAAHGAPGLKDTPLADATRRQVRQTVVGQMRKTSEFLELNQRLRREGIMPLVVKGLVCRQLYPLPDHRISADEDLLIPLAQFPDCKWIFEEFGMVCSASVEDLQKVQEIPWRRPGSPLYIELHLNLFPPESEAYGDLNRFFTEVFDRAEELEIPGGRILTMEPTDHLFYLICHAFKHFLHSGFGIRQVCDIAMFGKCYADRIDWLRLLDHCREIRAEKFAAALFEIGRKHLDLMPCPAYCREWDGIAPDEMPLLEDLLDSGIYGGADMERKHSSNITLSAAADQKKGRKAAGGVLRSLLPPAKSLENRYPYLKKAPALLPVAWISRIVSYGKQHGGDTAASASQSVRIGNRRLELMRQYGVLDE